MSKKNAPPSADSASRRIILARLKELEWGSYQLAEAAVARAGVSRTNVYEFLAGKRDILADAFLKLLDVLELEIRKTRRKPKPGTRAEAKAADAE